MAKNRRSRLTSEQADFNFSKSTFKTIKRIFKYISNQKALFILALIFSIISVVFEIYGPYVMGQTTNYVVESIKNGEFLFSEFLNYIYKLLGLYFLSFITSIFTLRIGIKLQANVIYNMRTEISNKLKRLPISYFDKTTTGNELSKMTNDVDTVAESVTQVVYNFLSSVCVVVGTLFMMIRISPRLSIISFLVAPLIMIVNSQIVKRSQKEFSKQWESLGDINGHIEEMISNNNLVKAYNYQSEAIESFEEKNKNLRESSFKSEFLSGIVMPVSMLISNAGFVAICVFGGFEIINGRINIGGFQAFSQYSKRFTHPIMNIAEILSVLQGSIAAADRVFSVLDEPEETLDSESSENIFEKRPIVQFKNVNFSYDKDPVIKNLNLKVSENMKVAIVGETGSGKTTLVNLLMRFYDVDSGEILLDKTDIRDFKRSDLRSYFSMVLQDTWLFKGTILDNIRYGKIDASFEEVIEASKMAHAHEFIEKLPNGYETEILEDASDLSEGEKQLLTIARAFLKSPEVLILDEATSSVDTRTERKIQSAMESLSRGRTSFIIAHRLSTIINSDKIVVLKDGEIVEEGTHNQLLENNGYYSELYSSQF